MFRNIQTYRNLNRALRLIVWLGLLSFIGVEYLFYTNNLWVLIIVFALLILQDLYTDGGAFNDQRVFVTEKNAADLVKEFALAKGFRQIEGESIHFAKWSNYIRVYMIHIYEKDGRLIVHVPKKFAEDVYALTTGALSAA